VEHVEHGEGWGEDYALEPSVTVVGAYPAPEGVAAGMARISRDATPIPELVRAAIEDTAMARKRNENIIFGYGHSSVAEHGVFGVAIEDIPRSLSVELVAHRLASYTQLSYRYVPLDRLRVHYFLPEELRQGRSRAIATRAMQRSYALYEAIYAAAMAHVLATGEKKGREAAARRATEDARYALPLAQTTQVGMTANARTWGHVICRLLSHELSEHRALGQRLKETLQPLAPSLFPEKYLQPRDYPAAALDALAGVARRLQPPTASRGSRHVDPPRPFLCGGSPPPGGQGEDRRGPCAGRGEHVRLLRCDPNAEAGLAGDLLFRTGHLAHDERAGLIARLCAEEVAEVVGAAFAGIGAHDTVLREFESVGYTFELVVSEACLHQLVRHRMSSQVVQARDGSLGYTVPPLIEETSTDTLDLYHEAMDVLGEAYTALCPLVGERRAGIMLGNGHNARLLLHLNARELIEMSRLRTDAHAQWDVRAVVAAMVEAVRAVHPAIAAGCGGRDAFKAGSLPLVASGEWLAT
jgi:flavin-dependent thymidylate synthase